MFPVLTYKGYGALMGGCLSRMEGGINVSRVRLFKNNVFPNKLSEWTVFEECDFAGYSPALFPSFSDSGLTNANVDMWVSDDFSFNMTAVPQQLAWGYWIDWINPGSLQRELIWFKRFASPFIFTGAGVSLTLRLTPGFSQCG